MTKGFIDWLGIAASWLCIVHCLGLPLFFLLFPALGGFAHHDDQTHYFLAGWVVTFVVLSLGRKYKQAKPAVVFCMLIGLTVVLIATFSHFFGIEERLEVPLITVGNLLVITGHYLKQKLSQSLTAEQHNCCAGKHDSAVQDQLKLVEMSK